jgi:hypothetical protein
MIEQADGDDDIAAGEGEGIALLGVEDVEAIVEVAAGGLGGDIAADASHPLEQEWILNEAIAALHLVEDHLAKAFLELSPGLGRSACGV